MKHLRFTIYDLRLKKLLTGLGFNRQPSTVHRQSSTVNRPWLILGISLFAILAWGAQDRTPELPRKESKFTMGRVFYDAPMTPTLMGGVGGYGPSWSHDWPRGQEHLMKIMSEVTQLDVNPSGHVISFQDDDCFKYPIAYLCEVGFMNLSKEEARRMSEYLLRGGFLIVDDFRGERELYNFVNEMKKVFPNRSLERLPRTHEIWKCFYDISDLDIEPPYSQMLRPQYYGISDDNGRLMMVVNYNNDISEYWEWSNDPMRPIEETNEAYQYGVNYLMYALTH